MKINKTYLILGALAVGGYLYYKSKKKKGQAVGVATEEAPAEEEASGGGGGGGGGGGAMPEAEVDKGDDFGKGGSTGAITSPVQAPVVVVPTTGLPKKPIDTYKPEKKPVLEKVPFKRPVEKKPTPTPVAKKPTVVKKQEPTKKFVDFDGEDNVNSFLDFDGDF